jgi:hypothetical protein
VWALVVDSGPSGVVIAVLAALTAGGVLMGVIVAAVLLVTAAERVASRPESDVLAMAYHTYAGADDRPALWEEPWPPTCRGQTRRPFPRWRRPPGTWRRQGAWELLLDRRALRLHELDLPPADWQAARRTYIWTHLAMWVAESTVAAVWCCLCYALGRSAASPGTFLAFPIIGLACLAFGVAAGYGWGWSARARPAVEERLGIVGATEQALLSLGWKRSALGWWDGDYILKLRKDKGK